MSILGIDMGGTFTDLVLFDEEKESLTAIKVPSTPEDEAKAVFESLDESGVNLTQIQRMVHGTTIGTNAILQRIGAKVSLITTKGFRDTLEIGRTRRMVPGSLFNIKFVRPQPLIPRSLRFEVRERTLYNGEILYPVSEADLKEVSKKIRDLGVEAVAICFLHSYTNQENEKRAGELLEQILPEIPISLSCEVVPEYREYERFSTTALNCFILPMMGRYLETLKKGLEKKGYLREILMMSSNGGVITSDSARKFPIKTILSGPVGGVKAGIFFAEAVGLKNIITYDMGGTSTDVCLIRDLEPSLSTETVLSGLPIKCPQVAVKTVGTGGGSIVWVDFDKTLKVGPRSAGAFPGPACYGFGGTEPTVTDANLILNRINPQRPLGGKISLHPHLAQKAISKLITKFQMRDEYQMAEGIIQMAAVKMVSAIREISLERGHDPRAYMLVAFGGAGPMHAIPIASGLGMRKCLVPRYPGHLSALGLLAAEIKYDFVKTIVSPLDGLGWHGIRSQYDLMKARAKSELKAQGFQSGDIYFISSMDMRYLGQAFEMDIPILPETAGLKILEEDFHRLYEETYGHVHKARALEVVNLRLSAVIKIKKPPLRHYQSPVQSVREAEDKRRRVYFDGEFWECPVYHRELLPQGSSLNGPCMLEESGATTVVFPSWKASVDEWGNILMEQLDSVRVRSSITPQSSKKSGLK